MGSCVVMVNSGGSNRWQVVSLRSVAFQCGRCGVSGEKSTPAHLSPKSVAPGQGKELLQLSVFGLGGDEDGDVGVGVFPESEEILIGGAGFGCITLEHVSAGEGEPGQWMNHTQGGNRAVCQ